jgi:hypothetical protein
MTTHGCERSELTSRYKEISANIAASSLTSDFEVQRIVSSAAAAERAIVFVHVGWAPMEPQRTRYAQFAHDYLELHPQENLEFYYVDCTPVTSGYAPLKRLAGWAELEAAAGASLIQGWGELVWMERGRVLHVERIQNFESISGLLNKTEALMPIKPRR